MSTNCYNPIKGIDDVISSKIQGWNKYRVATLRGMYDESHPSPLDTSDLDKAVQELISYRRNLGKVNAESIKTASFNLSESYQKLKESFSAEERFNRINMISTMFSDRLDALQEANPSLSRKVICNGFISNGKLVAGQFSVFEGVYNDLLEYYLEAVEEDDMDTANSYKKVLENWGALVSHARMRLRDTEELKLGNNIEYADDTNPDNYNDNKLSELYDASESKREAWQETSDMQSAFGSVGKQVRKLLGSIQRVENGEEVYDDLGFPIMLDPVKTHQSLIEILRGVTSENQMIGLLRNASSSQSWLQPVIEELENNDQLRTQFYVDFKKNFQPYSILLEEIKNELRTFKTLILNRVNISLSGQYLTSITLGKQVNPDTSVFNKDGSINWKNLQNLREIVAEYFPSKNVSIVPKFYSNKETSWQEKKRVLIKITEALGIDIDGNTLDRIMSNGRDLHKFTDAISELIEFGTDKILNKSELESLNKGNFSLSKSSFKDFIKFSPAGSTAKQGVIREKIDKMLTIITKNREGLRLESRVRHKDKNGNNITLFSNVIPSYLGDKMDRIASFVTNNDRQGLRRMIENEFLDSSFFMDNGTILNRWIKDLYESDLDEKSFATNFVFKRFLGTSDNSFENFTSKQHAIDMMTEYFSERQISPKNIKYIDEEEFNKSKNLKSFPKDQLYYVNGTNYYYKYNSIDSKGNNVWTKHIKDDYAYYPVFILGDSGVSKFIKAKRYSAKEILDGLYDVYRQERRRMALTKAANSKLKEEEYSPIENFSNKEDEYTILPFLNKDYKSPDGTVGKYAAMIGENPSKQEVVKAIQAYMEEAVNIFKKNLNNLGLLETKEVYNPNTNKKEVQYIYFSQEVNGDKTIDKVIADYYWNTKFATIQQLQLFTIDPAFYKGTKDLQKRYKEIHAPGSVLSLEARDFDGNLYSKDGIERCVYFDDINLNAELSNPEFMTAIKAKFGKNSPVYKAYTKNTLTDGQGYRTLESYRKVMGMAGKWTQEMENVYNAIKQLRAEYGKDAQIPSDKLAEIASMAVVFQPIKPYMYTIENYAVNNTDKLKIPVQHKYAEAVLIPELLPAGSKLRDMAYWMESKGVDLVGSTKIVKVGGFGSTDISKASNAKELNDALDKAYIHQLSYGDYRIQTNVPEHINSSQLFGTQVRKLIMTNVEMDDYHYENYVGGNKVNLGGKYGDVRLNGRNLVSFYNSLIVANILESYDLFANEVSDIKKLSDKLLQTTINNSRESMDNMLAYSLTGDDKFLVPLFEGALEHDSSAMLFSMFKKRVNKQSIKGGSAVQVSAMGIKGYEESGDLKYVVDPNNPNNILYAECEIPWDISYTDINGKEVTLEFSDYCNEDGTLKTDKDGNTLLEKKFPNALSILAYRIPTERDYSMINLRVKRFSQKTAGGTIKVPAQGTTIAGFDFDIDKLYFMRNEYRQRELSSSEVAEIWKEFYETYSNIKDVLKEAREEDTESLDRLYKYWDKAGLPYSYKEAFAQFIADRGYISFESYDFSKSPLDNTRAARNNMLIKLIQERLMDYETFEQRYTPGGFANASKAARTLRELLFGSLEGIVSRGTSTSKISGENISSKGSEFAKKLTNVGNNLEVTYKGVTFRNAEHAYQTWKSGEFDNTAYNSINTWKPVGSKPVNKQINFQIMVDILTEKLKQHPELIEGIKERGGHEYIISSTHNVVGDKYWESSGQNAFIKALAEAAINVGISPINNNFIKSTVDFNAIAERAKDSKSDPEPNYDPSDPMTIITYNQQNQVAGKLIGIFANQNTNHAFSSLMKEFTLKEPIRFAGHSYNDLLHAPKGIDVDLNVAEFLAASVDAVKDPVLNFLNLNTITADAGAVLARIGYTTQEIGLLFNQPIIKEICEYSFNNGVTADMAIREVVKNYMGDDTESPKANPDEDFSINKLALNIVNDRVMREQGKNAMDNKSFKADQLKVAELFSQIQTVAGDVSQFVTSTKFTASNAVGSTFGDLYSQQMKVKNYIDKFVVKNGKNALSVNIKVTDTIDSPITNNTNLQGSNQEYLESLIENPLAYEQAMYDMNRRANSLLNSYYPYETPSYRNARNRLASLTKNNFLDADTINSIHSDMLVYMLSQQEDSLFNGEIPIPVDSINTPNLDTTVNSYTGNITPDANTIFVFGSNPEGRHGAGAAKIAREQFGAIYGQGEGLQGNAYALPTKDLRVTKNNGLRSISEAQIIENIKKLYEVAKQNPDKQFKIAYRNTDKASLNGYTGLEMIDMFLKAGSIPTNIVFSKEWIDTGKFDLPTKKVQSTSKSYIPAREYYTKHFAKEVFNTLESNPDLKSLPLFQYMQFVTNEKTGDISMNVQGIGGLAPYQKDELKESWAELLKTEPDLASNLFMYNFYKLGFTFSPLAFMNLAPTELKLNMKLWREWDPSADNGKGAWIQSDKSYIDFLNEVKKGISVNIEEFAKQYILNHLDNRSLVFTAKGSTRDFLKKEVYKNGVAASEFTLKVSKLGDDAKNYTIADDTIPKSWTAFRPCIIVDGIVYMCESGNDKFNVSTDGSMTYRKVSQLGTTNKSLQYISDSETKITDSQTYDDKMPGSTKREDRVPEEHPEKVDRDKLVNDLIYYSLMNGNLVEESTDKFKEDISIFKDSDLKDTIEDIKNELREKGLIDKTGKKIC